MDAKQREAIITAVAYRMEELEKRLEMLRKNSDEDLRFIWTDELKTLREANEALKIDFLPTN